MARRYVTFIKKDENGEIIALYNPNSIWSPIGRDTAIMEIESGLNKYFVRDGGEIEIDLIVSSHDGRKVLLVKSKAVKTNTY